MKNHPDTQRDPRVLPMRVRSGIQAGQSVQACLNNLNYWRNELYKSCGKPKPPQITG